MNRVNLIPRERLDRQRIRRRTWFWITSVGLYTCFLAVAFTVSSAIGNSDDRTVRADLAEAQSIVASTELSLSTLREELDRTAALYFANLEVGSQPDWGILLALLAETTGDEIVLRKCRMIASPRKKEKPAPTETGAATERKGPREMQVRIEVNGIGRSQKHVTDFLLRMEDNRLFRDVKLQDTRREPFLHSHAVAFGIEFQLDAAGESP